MVGSERSVPFKDMDFVSTVKLVGKKISWGNNHRIHGHGIFAFIYLKNQPNAEKYAIFPWIFFFFFLMG